MSHFYRHPDGRRISKETLTVNGTSVRIGVWGPYDFQRQPLVVMAEADGVWVTDEAFNGDVRTFKIDVQPSAQKGRPGLHTKLFLNTQNWDTWDECAIQFNFPTQPGAETLSVRSLGEHVFGAKGPWFASTVPVCQTIIPGSYRKHDSSNAPLFATNAAKRVAFSVFAAKYGAVERSYIIVLPTAGVVPVNRVMVVISHTFGQQLAYYSALGFADPTSPRLIKDVIDRFAIQRWGAQLFAARSDTAIFMPVRAKSTGGGELGPFANKAGAGKQIIEAVCRASGAVTPNHVELVTYSSGIDDANAFVNVGAKGLGIRAAYIQDPSGGRSISAAVPVRKQYLSGWTTHGKDMAGFEWFPMARFANEFNYPRFKGDARLVHDWYHPQYLLHLGLVT